MKFFPKQAAMTGIKKVEEGEQNPQQRQGSPTKPTHGKRMVKSASDFSFFVIRKRGKKRERDDHDLSLLVD
jgi:hypothetical protein